LYGEDYKQDILALVKNNVTQLKGAKFFSYTVKFIIILLHNLYKRRPFNCVGRIESNEIKN